MQEITEMLGGLIVQSLGDNTGIGDLEQRGR